MIRLLLKMSEHACTWLAFRAADLEHYGYGGGAWTGSTRWSVSMRVSRP